MRRVLNVGGGSKRIPIPRHYQGWDHVLLDIDAEQKPDVVGDARDLVKLPGGEYDAIYCSHNLEHYWRHDLPRVLAGFAHVLHANGFVEAFVPDIRGAMEDMARRGLELDDVLYDSALGPVTVNDVIYGLGREIATSGSDFYAHKNAFTPKSLAAAFAAAGFARVFVGLGKYEIQALAFKSEPTAEQRSLLGMRPAAETK